MHTLTYDIFTAEWLCVINFKFYDRTFEETNLYGCRKIQITGYLCGVLKVFQNYSTHSPLFIHQEGAQ